MRSAGRQGEGGELPAAAYSAGAQPDCARPIGPGNRPEVGHRFRRPAPGAEARRRQPVHQQPQNPGGRANYRRGAHSDPGAGLGDGNPILRLRFPRATAPKKISTPAAKPSSCSRPSVFTAAWPPSPWSRLCSTHLPELSDALQLPLPEAERSLLAAILLQEDEDLTPERLEGAVRALWRIQYRRKLELIQRELQATPSGEASRLQALLQEKLRLKRALMDPGRMDDSQSAPALGAPRRKQSAGVRKIRRVKLNRG